MFRKFMMLAGCLAVLCAGLPATRAAAADTQALDARQVSIIGIAAYTANGDLARLKPALVRGLEAGLTVNEVKEILVQLYAYTGFPRSLNGIHTFMALMKEREQAGIKDPVGKEASPMPADLDRDRYGAETRAKLGGKTTIPPAAGYQLFTPAIDAFLKQHLFADIFYRDNLDWQSRELATISALAAMSGTAGQQRFHQNAAMNMGLTEAQMRAFVAVIEKDVDKDLARVSRDVLEAILSQRKK